MKVYSGTMVLGATTPSYDLEQAIDSYYPYQHITLDNIQAVLSQFTGDIQQTPPLFSAVKIDGKRAYTAARTALTDANDSLKPRTVHIHAFEITAFRAGTAAPIQQLTPDTHFPTPYASSSSPHLYRNPLGEIPSHLPQLDFRITCGKGTYIRSLARDLGIALGSGAFLSALCREQVGDYTLAYALQLDEIESYLTRLLANRERES